MANWSRRSVLNGMLKGAAVSVGLPLLNCMLNDNGKALASGLPIPTRFGTWFWPCGVNAHRFFPDSVGANYDLKPELAPLKEFKQKVSVFSGFNVDLDGQPNLVHWSGIMGALTGTAPKKGGNGVGTSDAPTLDMLVADHFGSNTRFKSVNFSCTGSSSVSYSMRAGTTMNSTEIDPLALYQKLFGADFKDPNSGTFTPDPATMMERSVLSGVTEGRHQMMKQVGAEDRARLEQYFTSVRELEQRLALQLQKPEPVKSCVIPKPPTTMAPGATWESATAVHDAMAELLVMALACNQTRVFHGALSIAVSNLRRRGTAVALHELTHQESVDKKLGYQIESTFFLERMMGVFANLLRMMDSIKEGDGTLLDNSLILATSESNFAKLHTVESLPMIVAGSAGGKWRSGIHVKSKGDTTSRIGLTMQQALGIPIGSWGTGANKTSHSISEVLV